MCVQVYVTIIEIAKTHNCRSQILREISFGIDLILTSLLYSGVIARLWWKHVHSLGASGPTDSQYQHFLMNELINRVCE